MYATSKGTARKFKKNNAFLSYKLLRRANTVRVNTFPIAKCFGWNYNWLANHIWVVQAGGRSVVSSCSANRLKITTRKYFYMFQNTHVFLLPNLICSVWYIWFKNKLSNFDYTFYFYLPTEISNEIYISIIKRYGLIHRTKS